MKQQNQLSNLIPVANLLANFIAKLPLTKSAFVFAFCVAAAIASPAQTYTTLANFDLTNGANPVSGVVQGFSGNFYGTAQVGGLNNDSGVVFEITASGNLTTLYSFCSQANCADGETPYAALVQATNGNLYGTTFGGGVNDSGTVFEVTPAGKLVTLYSFCSQANCADGKYTYAPLMQARNGAFYGTTYEGGTNNEGTVFEITPAGKLRTLYSFCSQANCTDGEFPRGGVIQAPNGNLYGTTVTGGIDGPFNGQGTIFEITPAGKLTTVYIFCPQLGCADGANPYAGLTQASNGNFYGTTFAGGAKNNGTVFGITAGGKFTTLHSFCTWKNCLDGQDPAGGLVQATNGNFYGTTTSGGANGHGTIFEIAPSGAMSILYNFCAQTNCSDGLTPYAGLIQATNGIFYGTTVGGGSDDVGTVFSLSTGLAPFVETLPTSGKVGASVITLGNNLTGATSVTFNGTPATFTVISSTQIKTTVPSGATSGPVQVSGPDGTFNSNVVFRVTP
jgi:uncharacterized repeat protein (TIGR03803 family)